jgi:hypothetical protein
MATISKTMQQRLAQQEDRLRQKAARERAAHDAQIDALIAESGWAVCVADSDTPGDPAPHFGYTIGRTLKGQPELCAWGHAREDIQTTLNLIGGFLEREGIVAEPGYLLSIPTVGAWEMLRVPPEVFSHLEFAKQRYTFLRAVRLRRIM